MVDDLLAGSEFEEASASEVEEVQEDQPEADEEILGEAEEAEDASEEDAEDSDQPEDELDPSEVAEADIIEVEYDGKVHKVPSELKDALMLTKDYTHKTQELGEQRRAFETEQQDFRQYVEASQVHSEKMAQLAGLDLQLQQFEQHDWNAHYDADLAGATKLRHQMEQLGQQRNALVQDIQEAEGERQNLYNENLAKTAKRTDEQLRSEIPNWGDELKSELGKFAVETMGFPAEAVAKAVTPQEIKALYYAQVGFKAIASAKAKEAQAKKPAEQKAPPKATKPRRQKAPTDLSKISDPVRYREMRMKQRAAKQQG